ncbi:MAG: right-handed parallel beta-helix repeat-containing protein, partial [Phycisphaerales bacterium]
NILDTSFLALGNEAVSFARPFTISPSGTGSLADAAWYTTNGATPEFDPDTGYRVLLGRFFVDQGATLGGAFGGPNADTQSRVYVGWMDDIGIRIGVFDVPVTVTCAPVLRVDVGARPDGDGLEWASAFNDLQAALQTATTCGGAVSEIWVAAGSYIPAEPLGDRTISFDLRDGVAVYGGFPPGGGKFDERDPIEYETILSGDLNADDNAGGDNSENSYHVLSAIGILDGVTTILDGFIITAGNAGGVDDPQDDDAGGLLLDGSSLTVVNCVFAGNTAFAGGAMSLLNSSFLQLINCKLIANTAANGGGLAQSTASFVEMVNCLVVDNQAADHSGAINSAESTLHLINCTVSNNDAPQADAIRIDGETSVATIANCVLWGNGDGVQDDQIMLAQGALPTNLNVDYSCVQGWTGEYRGIGNIDADPLFVDPNAADYHMLSDSHCIDAADNIAVPERVTTDLDGNPRFVDVRCTDDTGNGTAPVVDMGVFEFQVTCPWDLDCNGSVGASDLLTLLASWGPCKGCLADFDGNGAVGASDLLALLANWGPCP